MLTNIIFSVLWSRSGLDGTEDAVWRERGQVFSVLTKLGSSCQLVRPPDDIKRRSVMTNKCIPPLKEQKQRSCLALEKQIRTTP